MVEYYPKEGIIQPLGSKEKSDISWLQFVLVLTLLILLVSIVFLGVANSYDIIIQKNPNREFNNQVSTFCQNLSLEGTSLCLRERLRPFYNYTVTRDDLFRSIPDILNSSGDCLDYSRVYESWAKGLGFSTFRPVIETGNSSAHTFTVISNEEGYCILDQMAEVECQHLADVSGEKDD